MMSVSLLLYWLPIFVGVAFGAQAVSRRHAAVLGVVCGALWVAVVQANVAQPLWYDLGSAASAICGAVAIVLVGYCGSARGRRPARESDLDGPAGTDDFGVGDPSHLTFALDVVEAGAESVHSSGDQAVSGAEPPAHRLVSGHGLALQSLISVYQQFDAWLEVHRYDDDPWADFDEFVRSVLFQWVGGIHVRTYRVVSEGDELIPMRQIEPMLPAEMVSARRGVEGYVATTGRSFVAGDPTQGGLVDQLLARREAAEAESSGADRSGREGSGPVWCFAVLRGARKVGVVAVEGFDTSVAKQESLREPTDWACPWSTAQLRVVELVIGEFWKAVTEVWRGRAAVTTDPGSGGLTRKAFFEIGRELLADAYRQGEPAAVAVIAMEGIRGLDDDGEWELADDVRGVISSVLRQRLRSEDRLGRFDDSRFVLLLRRVDSELAALIAEELMDRLTGVLSARPSYAGRISLRCGLAGSGVTGDAPDAVKRSLERLVEVAVELCQQARQTSVMIASDLHPAEAAHRVSSPDQ